MEKSGTMPPVVTRLPLESMGIEKRYRIVPLTPRSKVDLEIWVKDMLAYRGDTEAPIRHLEIVGDGTDLDPYDLHISTTPRSGGSVDFDLEVSFPIPSGSTPRCIIQALSDAMECERRMDVVREHLRVLLRTHIANIPEKDYRLLEMTHSQCSVRDELRREQIAKDLPFISSAAAT